ncbi:hypothetical protein N7499_003226 [Penicillium canescens]|uniref:uncharacterized protein n=1 Tax=Penicillium canescens TaxID=5083 RepID=UPI0026DF77F6|nr:uncharacterized protein N7446_014172 [Penicillium canescens]KAJ6038930.1 hypothetical protein N7446_014172 [Penicillium canescens]KAJ6091066.1 hypothetical protein N7499_003217 [Penicillium canescens]KAJ6091075.1 hypothetical protein N7499_003226 [Penicillium canescens]
MPITAAKAKEATMRETGDFIVEGPCFHALLELLHMDQLPFVLTVPGEKDMLPLGENFDVLLIVSIWV